MANTGQRAGPPPPPPPPGARGGPGNDFVVLGGGNRGGPPPLPAGARVGAHGPMPGPAHGHQGPPPPQMMPQQQQQQRRVHNSIQYSDITPRKPITEEDCRKKLTTYMLFHIRKQPDMKKDSIGTWAKVQFTNESLAQEDIAKGVKCLNENTKSVAEKKAKLFPFQQQQVTKLLDGQISQETDQNFQWSLAQLDRDEKINKQGKRETLVICVYLKREPIRDISCVALYTAIDRENKRREEALIRGPQPQQQQQQQPMPQHHAPLPGHDDGHGQPKIMNLGKMGDKMGGKGGKGGKDRGRPRRHDHSDEESESDSFYESDDSRSSFASSTQATSISSRSNDRHRGRRPSHGRSFSRHRPEPKQHRIAYGRIDSPERPAPPPPTRPYVPDIPRQLHIPAIMPTTDPVAAAYKAGRVDAEAERYGLADRYPREPERRYSPEPVRLVDPRLQPTAVVTYAAPVTRYQDPLPMRPRYDDRFEEPRREIVREEYVRYAPSSPRTEEFYRARERAAEDYVEYRRPRGGESYYDERIYRHEPRRRYAPSSVDSWALN